MDKSNIVYLNAHLHGPSLILHVNEDVHACTDDIRGPTDNFSRKHGLFDKDIHVPLISFADIHTDAWTVRSGHIKLTISLP